MLQQAQLTAPQETPGASKKASKANLAVPYALATVFGSVAVFVSPDLWWVPIAGMFLYLGFGLNEARRDEFTLEFSDSFYYLGFTLTIASLLASLRPFSGGTSTSEVLRYFGLGLFTTLVGVIGRTVMQMFYRTPGETIEATNQRIEVLTRDYLSNLEHVNDRTKTILGSTLTTLETDLRTGLAGVRASVETLHASLDAAVRGVDSFRLDPSQLQTAMNDLHGRVRESAMRLQGGLDELVKVGQSYATAANAVDKAAAQAEGQVGKATATLARRVDDIGQSVEDLSRRIASAGLDPQKAQDSLDNLAASIAASSSRVSEQLRALADSTSAVVGGVISAASRLNGLQLSELEQSARSFSASVESFATRIRESGESLDAGALKTLRDSLGNTAGQAHKMNVVLDEIVEAVRLKLAQIE